MIAGRFRHLPVLTNGAVQGTLSMRDLTQWLIESVNDREGRVTASR
jgi:hypothetical protein